MLKQKDTCQGCQDSYLADKQQKSRHLMLSPDLYVIQREALVHMLATVHTLVLLLHTCNIKSDKVINQIFHIHLVIDF